MATHRHGLVSTKTLRNRIASDLKELRKQQIREKEPQELFPHFLILIAMRENIWLIPLGMV